MSSESTFQLQFTRESRSVKIDFCLPQKTTESVVYFNGRDYSLLGEQNDIEQLRKQIPELLSHRGCNSDNLKKRLSSFGATEIELTEICQAGGVNTLHRDLGLQVEVFVERASPKKEKNIQAQVTPEGSVINLSNRKIVVLDDGDFQKMLREFNES